MPFIEELKNIFKNKGNGLMKIIIINIALFIVVNIVSAFTRFSGSDSSFINTWLALPSDFTTFITHPWTLLSYIFLHLDLMHILFNMLWLYWIGKIFIEYLGSERLVSTYLLGGIFGGVLFIIVSNLFPSFYSNSYLLGVSAGVMAIVIGTAALVPEYVIHLMFFGPVKLKYLALVSFLITTILDFSVNTGGKIAHIGGALYGLIYISQYKKGRDISKNFNALIFWISSLFKNAKKSKMKVAYKRKLSDEQFNQNKIERQKKMDEILDKISKSGYESLSKQEKEILFEISSYKSHK